MPTLDAEQVEGVVAEDLALDAALDRRSACPAGRAARPRSSGTDRSSFSSMAVPRKPVVPVTKSRLPARASADASGTCLPSGREAVRHGRPDPRTSPPTPSAPGATGRRRSTTSPGPSASASRRSSTGSRRRRRCSAPASTPPPSSWPRELERDPGRRPPTGGRGSRRSCARRSGWRRGARPSSGCSGRPTASARRRRPGSSSGWRRSSSGRRRGWRRRWTPAGSRRHDPDAVVLAAYSMLTASPPRSRPSAPSAWPPTSAPLVRRERAVEAPRCPRRRSG